MTEKKQRSDLDMQLLWYTYFLIIIIHYIWWTILTYFVYNWMMVLIKKPVLFIKTTSYYHMLLFQGYYNIDFAIYWQDDAGIVSKPLNTAIISSVVLFCLSNSNSAVKTAPKNAIEDPIKCALKFANHFRSLPTVHKIGPRSCKAHGVAQCECNYCKNTLVTEPCTILDRTTLNNEQGEKSQFYWRGNLIFMQYCCTMYYNKTLLLKFNFFKTVEKEWLHYKSV